MTLIYHGQLSLREVITRKWIHAEICTLLANTLRRLRQVITPRRIHFEPMLLASLACSLRSRPQAEGLSASEASARAKRAALERSVFVSEWTPAGGPYMYSPEVYISRRVFIPEWSPPVGIIGHCQLELQYKGWWQSHIGFKVHKPLSWKIGMIYMHEVDMESKVERAIASKEN